jgi:bifunctional UDP-N-acetylglucosamine pyrophosphorylase/glucosamine-1-phosphate N-acetyltransferase
MKREFFAVILVSGEGTRLLGKSALELVLEPVLKTTPTRVYLVADPQDVELGRVLRKERTKDVLLLNADLPLLKPETLRALARLHQENDNSLTLLAAEKTDPEGCRRVVRFGGGGVRVVQDQKASLIERKIREIDAGVYMFKAKDLVESFAPALPSRRQTGLNIIKIIEILVKRRRKTEAYKTRHSEEALCLTRGADLAMIALALRIRKARALAASGVSVLDPLTSWIDLDIQVGRETVIHPSVILEGRTKIGRGCRLYPFSHIVDSAIGNRVRILPSTVIQESTIEDDAQVGPFTHLRPKTVIRSGARVGNFVEMKNTLFGKRSKAGHLSYLGDSEVGENVNIGAGTITCNFDGVKKSKTLIEKGAFIGSGSELIAPLKVGKGAYIGAGSTITKDVSPGALAVARGRQFEKAGWAARKRRKPKK